MFGSIYKKGEFLNPVINIHLILRRKCSFVTEKEINSLVVKGDLETLKILINNRSDQNPVVYEYQDGTKSSVLDQAAYWGHLNITIWYKDVLGFSDINPKDNKGNTPLFWAIGQRQLDVVKYYIENGDQASSKVFSPFVNSYLCLANTVMSMHTRRNN